MSNSAFLLYKTAQQCHAASFTFLLSIMAKSLSHKCVWISRTEQTLTTHTASDTTLVKLTKQNLHVKLSAPCPVRKHHYATPPPHPSPYLPISQLPTHHPQPNHPPSPRKRPPSRLTSQTFSSGRAQNVHDRAAHFALSVAPPSPHSQQHVALRPRSPLIIKYATARGEGSLGSILSRPSPAPVCRCCLLAG